MFENIAKNIKKFVEIVFGLLFFGLSFVNISVGDDIMYNIFSPSMVSETVIDIGKTKEDVGHAFLRKTIGIDIGTGVYTEAPLIVRITKLILRITIVLSVTMVIFCGVKFLISLFKGTELKNLISDMKNILIGLLVALLSVSVINLVVSISKSSITTGDDITGIGCRVGDEIISGMTLKEYICLNSKFGHPEYTMPYRFWKNRIGNNCRFPDDNKFNSNTGQPLDISCLERQGNNCGEYKAITNSEMRNECVSTLNGQVIE